MRKIRKGDNVIVNTGKDKGKTGEIMAVITKGYALKVVVKGVNIVKRHQKPNQNLGIVGGIIESERAIDISNVSLVNEKGKPAKVSFKVEKGKKTRIIK